VKSDLEAPTITLWGALPLALRRAYAEAEAQGVLVQNESGRTDGQALDLASVIAAALSEVWNACHGEQDLKNESCPPLPLPAAKIITDTRARLRIATSVR
jgi:hypothetical protein